MLSEAKHRANGQTILEYALWGLGVCVALAFVVIKVRAWGVMDAPEQKDLAVYYMGGRVSLVSPAELYRPDRYAPRSWAEHLGADAAGPANVYNYAPTFALLMRPLARLPYAQARRIWFWGSVVALVVAGSGLYLLGRRWLGPIGGASAVGLWLLMPATLDTLYHGQVNAFLALLVTLAALGLYAFNPRWHFVGGMLAGLTAGIKFFLLSLFALSLFDKGWRYAFGFVLAVLIFVVVGLAAFPLATWFDPQQGFIGTAGSHPALSEALVQNQSLFGFWRKLSAEGTVPLILQGQPLGEIVARPLISASLANALMYAGAAAIVSLSLWSLWRLSRRAADGLAPAWGVIFCAALIVFPLVWPHYMTIAVPLFPALLALRKRLSYKWRLLLPLGYLLIVAERGKMLWLPRFQHLALSSPMLFGLFLWGLVLVRDALCADARPSSPWRQGP